VSWETAERLGEEELDRRLFAVADRRDVDRPLPDWEVIEKELRGRGVTLRLLWLEYLAWHPEGYRFVGGRERRCQARKCSQNWV
jgi:transposase